MMKPEPYCLDLKFKDHSISNIEHHAHLYIAENEIYIEINIGSENSDLDRRFMMSKNSLGFFEDEFEIVKSEVELKFEKSQIYLIRSNIIAERPFFTLFLTNICIIRPNIHSEDIDIGVAVLNKNGLTVVNNFYSFFTNFDDKNKFEISRMKSMKDYYNFLDLTYRPELDYIGNDKRGSKKFTITKKPTITFKYKDSTYEKCKEHIESICKILSFFYGIRIEYHKLIYRTPNLIYVYINNEKKKNKYVSELSTINRFLKKSNFIENFLKANWQTKYLLKKSKFDKAIENLLHSREVESSAKYLLLFNIIEIFNINQQTNEKFELNNLKDENLNKAKNLIEKTLVNTNEIELFREKWEGTINKIFIKPIKSPLEETLKSNGINVKEFGYTFKKLKTVRDKLTHGSTNSISEDELNNYTGAMRRICICLILYQLGFEDEIKNGI